MIVRQLSDDFSDRFLERSSLEEFPFDENVIFTMGCSHSSAFCGQRKKAYASLLNEMLETQKLPYKSIALGTPSRGMGYYTYKANYKKWIDVLQKFKKKKICIIQKMDLYRVQTTLLPNVGGSKRYQHLKSLKRKDPKFFRELQEVLMNLYYNEYVEFLRLYSPLFDKIIYWDGTFNIRIEDKITPLFENVLDIQLEDSHIKTHIREKRKSYNMHPNKKYFQELLCPQIIDLIK